MSMQPEQAKFLLAYLMASVESEYAITLKVLAAMPAGKEDYRPDPKSMNALDLAWHIASADWWFLTGIAKGGFPSEEGKRPAEITNAAQVVEWYKANVPPAIEKVKGLGGEALTKTIDFFGVVQLSAVEYLSLQVVHTVHHRGQLSTYLRPMGGKVPSIYGGSADEPWQPPA